MAWPLPRVSDILRLTLMAEEGSEEKEVTAVSADEMTSRRVAMVSDGRLPTCGNDRLNGMSKIAKMLSKFLSSRNQRT